MLFGTWRRPFAGAWHRAAAAHGIDALLDADLNDQADPRRPPAIRGHWIAEGPTHMGAIGNTRTIMYGGSPGNSVVTNEKLLGTIYTKDVY